ncbi:MAG: cupin domain-containing protein [Candidatus Acidiferrales bacterium]
MAILRVPQLGRTFIMPAEIETFLAGMGVEYRRWMRVNPIPAAASAQEILKTYEPELESYRTRREFSGYDVVDLEPETPGLEEMLREFKREHWHDDYEARFILAGRGVCNVHPAGGVVVTIELEPGDLISIGPGIRHWFDLCAEKRFRAIRFLATAENDRMEYTASGIEADYEPVCMGPAYFPAKAMRLARTVSHSL